MSLGKFEDPEKVLNQAVEDLQKDLVTIRQSYAEVMATQKRCARGVPSCRDAFDATRGPFSKMLRAGSRQKDQADQWRMNGTDGPNWRLEKGDDELAREALSHETAAS